MGFSTLNPPIPIPFPTPTPPRLLCAIEAANIRSSAIIIEFVLEGNFGNTSKILSLFTIRSERTKSLLQLAAAEVVVFTDAVLFDTEVTGGEDEDV